MGRPCLVLFGPSVLSLDNSTLRPLIQEYVFMDGKINALIGFITSSSLLFSDGLELTLLPLSHQKGQKSTDPEITKQPEG